MAAIQKDKSRSLTAIPANRGWVRDDSGGGDALKRAPIEGGEEGRVFRLLPGIYDIVPQEHGTRGGSDGESAGGAVLRPYKGGEPAR